MKPITEYTEEELLNLAYNCEDCDAEGPECKPGGCLLELEILRRLKAGAEAKRKLEDMRKRIAGLHRTHHYCEDSWYSCPLAEDGCADERETGCNCGADAYNKEIDAILSAGEDV
jgi:hypothetical protein